MNDIIQKDLYRYEGERSKLRKTFLRYLFFTPGFQFTYFFRKASNAKSSIAKVFWTILHRLCMWKFGIQIPVGTEIGEGFRIAHFGTIVVNPSARIGKNFTISQGALIGNSGGKHPGSPQIGESVFVGANAIVIGGITVGDNCMIAPGSFVNFDVPEDSIVIGNPAKVIPATAPSKKYIVYKV